MTEGPLERRFAQNIRRLTRGEREHLLVAVSGGMDSTVLLHLLRHHDPLGSPLTAAHYDHRMRPESGEDALWVRKLCAEWGIDLVEGAAEEALRGEEAAREARYAFLRASACSVGAALIATGHHADDQAETVLFRIVRGTGLHGLAGIRPRSRSGLIRPLLPFWRDEVADYAVRHGLSWRSDASNATMGPARNRLRIAVLPEIERQIAPAARRNLVSLAELARESELAWRALLASARRDVLSREGGALVLARDRLRGYDRRVQTRLVRHALRRFGIVPSRAGTRIVLAFITDAPSGREHRLGGGVRVRTEFENVRIERSDAVPGDDVPLSIESFPDEGFASEVRLGGRGFRVEVRNPARGGAPVAEKAIWTARLSGPFHFPLTIRGRQPGDTMRTSGGTKSLKKLMIERRVPQKDRARRPIAVDACGRVLWVAGLGTNGDRDDGNVDLELSFHEA